MTAWDIVIEHMTTIRPLAIGSAGVRATAVARTGSRHGTTMQPRT